MMTEKLLQYIWQFRYVSAKALQTTTGQPLQIVFPGEFNTNQGPDFLKAKIKIEDTLWVGNVELHVYTSDWQTHQHSADENYKNIILHVVWINNVNLSLDFPTLELQHYVPKLLLRRYEELMQHQPFIPCQEYIAKTNALVLSKWKERMLIERLQQKAAYIEILSKRNNSHWEETCWWLLARNMGSKINADAFELMAQSIPFNLLTKHKQQLIQLEALLMGQAGLLNKDYEDEYPKSLQKEYWFLQHKYKLKSIKPAVHFLRMRPANFPTLRLAQLAAIIQSADHLFDHLREIKDIKEAERLFNVDTNEYWNEHYVFDEKSNHKMKHVGQQMISTILINVAIPLLFTYGLSKREEQYMQKALSWLSQIKPEKNTISIAFEGAGLENNNAYDSQALLHMKSAYCAHKKCLSCAIGNYLLKGEPL